MHLDAHLGPRLLDRLGDVGIGQVAQRPRPLVDDVSLDPSVGERGDHLEAEGRGLDHDGRPHGVERLVPLHRTADVLDVVQPVQVGSGDARIGVVEPGRDDQAVVAEVALALDLDRAGLDVERRDPGLVANVDALLDVGLLRRQEERLEVGDLLAVDVRDPTRAVGRVLELGEDDHLTVRSGPLECSGRADPRRTAADHDCPRCHRHPFETRRASRSPRLARRHLP